MRRLALVLFMFLLVCPCADSFSFGKKDKIPKSETTEPVEIPEYDNYGHGYVGTLPDISGSFSSPEPDGVKPEYEKTKNFNSSNELKPVPRDNPAFVNIILKTDKTSP